jgi:hypothetical protein
MYDDHNWRQGDNILERDIELINGNVHKDRWLRSLSFKKTLAQAVCIAADE